jgi:antitoxin MazE
LVIRSAAKPRVGWSQAFEQLHRQGDDQLIDQESTAASAWDRSEWTW